MSLGSLHPEFVKHSMAHPFVTLFYLELPNEFCNCARYHKPQNVGCIYVLNIGICFTFMIGKSRIFSEGIWHIYFCRNLGSLFFSSFGMWWCYEKHWLSYRSNNLSHFKLQLPILENLSLVCRGPNLDNRFSRSEMLRCVAICIPFPISHKRVCFIPGKHFIAEFPNRFEKV